MISKPDSLDDLPIDLLDDIFESLKESNMKSLNSIKSCDQFHQFREIIFKDFHVKLVYKICRDCKFDYSILSSAIELCEKIFDATIQRYLPQFYHLILKLFIERKLIPNEDLLQSTLSSNLFVKFFGDFNDHSLSAMMNRLSRNSVERFSRKCFTIFALTSVSLAIKLNGNNNSYRMRNQLNEQFKRSNLLLPSLLSVGKFYALVENQVMKLLNFNLHIDSLDCYLDAVLAKFKNKSPNLCIDSQVKAKLSLYLATLYIRRIELSERIAARSNQTNSLLIHEYIASDKFLQSIVIALAILPIRKQSYDCQLEIYKEIENLTNLDIPTLFASKSIFRHYPNLNY